MIVDHRRRLESVHARHAHIEQHDREFLLHEPLERFKPGAGRDQVLAQVLENGLVRQQARRLIIDQQDVHLRANLGVHRCNHIRTSDSSWSLFTGFAT